MFRWLAVVLPAALVALAAYYGFTENISTIHALIFTLLACAAALSVTALIVALYAGRLAGCIRSALDRLAEGNYSPGIPGCAARLRGVPESFDRLARALAERHDRDSAELREADMLRQKSAGLEERLTSANSDLTRKEAMLREANRELIDSNRAKSEVISRMGRELRMPLNTIIGLADFLAQERLGPLNTRQRDYVDKIRARAHNLLDIENNIVEYSMLEYSGPQVTADVALDRLAGEVAASLSRYADERKVAIELRVTGGRLKADQDKLRHIMYNLLHNAVKFNLPGGRAVLSAGAVSVDKARTMLSGAGIVCPPDATGGFVEVAVEDTGIGIPRQVYGELFRPFSQIPDVTGRKPAGAGLSLFLAKRFVEQHGGFIWVDEAEGGGSRFHAMFPADFPALATAAACARKKKVLLVEDDPDQMALVSAFLAGSPYDIVRAGDGLDALNVLEELTPDIILMDVMMPRMDGIEACRAVKRQERFKGLSRVPVVLMTSLTDMENKLNAIKAGADDVIFKPIDRRLLTERIKSLLEAKEELEDVMASYKDLEKEALVDPLTGLFNRRYMDNVVAREFINSKRYGRNLSVLMLDLDHFKAYNDMFGHLAGDEILKKAASLFVDSVREVDIVARYGGEEFMVILPETPHDLAIVVAERIRSSVAANTPITLSIGQASFPEDAGELSELIKNADIALYRAKESGRDRTVGYRDCQPPPDET